MMEAQTTENSIVPHRVAAERDVCPSIMNSPLPFVLMPPRAVALGRLVRFLLASVLVALLPACQGLREARETGHTTDHLEQAKQAWQVMERESPGTVPAQNALRTYDRAVAAVVKSLRAKEGTSAWGKPVMLGGVRP